MAVDESKAAAIEACVKEFDQFMKQRIEQLNQLLSNGNMRHRDQLKTERAEAEVIQIHFETVFARWL
jgi:hypothetical protein